jgi:predicted outer membrane repeat protein
VIIRNSIFKQNYASERGGAVYLQNASAYFNGGNFEENSTGDNIASSKGGAVYLKDGAYEMLGVSFLDNQSLVGGGLYTDNSSLVMDKCDFFQNNSLAGGGAMVCHESGLIDVDECNFEDNTAGGSGGAVAILEGLWARFTFCNFYNNSSYSDQYLSDGGGVFITPYDNLGIFINCNFSKNEAKDYGGGAYATSISQFIGCLFNANRADTDSTEEVGGGALALSEASFPILNCTFSGNTGGIGTTIYCEDAEFSMINSILWDDNGDPAPKIFMSNLEEIPVAFLDHCNIESGNGIIRGSGDYEVNWASGNISLDPVFEITGEDFRLSDNSPCIDTARSDTLSLLIPTKDLAGNPRIFHGEIDMGCYENQTPFMIPEEEVVSEFLIYPNPASGQINIRYNQPGEFSGKIEILDLSGRMLAGEPIHFSAYSSIEYPLPDLAEGIYIIRLIDMEKRYISKLLISQ